MSQLDSEYQNIRFVIFEVTELSLIDFTQVYETSYDTVRKSVDETKTFVKWEGIMPTCVSNLTTKEGPYTYSEMLAILSTSEWIKPLPNP
jgi:hypothetical protein